MPRQEWGKHNKLRTASPKANKIDKVYSCILWNTQTFHRWSSWCITLTTFNNGFSSLLHCDPRSICNNVSQQWPWSHLCATVSPNNGSTVTIAVKQWAYKVFITSAWGMPNNQTWELWIMKQKAAQSTVTFSLLTLVGSNCSFAFTPIGARLFSFP